jgi:hypothetical protein
MCLVLIPEYRCATVLAFVQFTMQALISMASGAPLDMQRSSRWPSQETQVEPRGTKGVAVDWAQHQIDSDYDDLEGIFPPQQPNGPADREGHAADDDDDEWAS